MSDIVIKAENLGKKYIIGHQTSNGRYTAPQDVWMRNARSLWRKIGVRTAFSERPKVKGETSKVKIQSPEPAHCPDSEHCYNRQISQISRFGGPHVSRHVCRSTKPFRRTHRPRAAGADQDYPARSAGRLRGVGR